MDIEKIREIAKKIDPKSSIEIEETGSITVRTSIKKYTDDKFQTCFIRNESLIDTVANLLPAYLHVMYKDYDDEEN